MEEITLDQFHRRMGHISPEVARKLVEKGFATGIRLETTASGDPFFCESCVYAKSTRKPVQETRQSARSLRRQNYGEDSDDEQVTQALGIQVEVAASGVTGRHSTPQAPLNQNVSSAL